MNALDWLELVVVLLLAVLLDASPRLSRPGLFFGITVEAGFSRTDAGRRIAAGYRRWVWGSASAAVLAVIAAPRAAGAVAPGLQVLAAAAGFALAHRSARAYAIPSGTRREAELAPRPAFPRTVLAAALAPLALIAAAFLRAWWAWESLPARIPVHWGLTGRPDRWIDRTPASLALLLGGFAALCALLLVLLFLIHGARRIAVTGPAAAAEARFRRRVLWMLVAGEYLVALPAVLAVTHPAPPGGLAAGALGAALAALAAALVLVLRAGQGGARGEPAPLGDRTPDACWKWGMFYYNPDDPAVLVEKRFGLGYTLNFARPLAWIVLLALLAPVVPLALIG